MSKKKCIAKTKKGASCKSTALPGSDYCASHQSREKTARMVKDDMAQPQPAFSHPSKKRCETISKNYPAFLNRQCGALMRTSGTKENGRIKYWICPKCGATIKTVGKKI